MKTQPTHTPTPWTYHLGRGKYPRFHIQTTGGYQIASTPELDSLSKEENEVREHDAAFIVRAVNVHAELLATVKSMRLYIDTFSKESKDNFRAGGNGEYVDALIDKAEGK